jgi:hypothetical protein
LSTERDERLARIYQRGEELRRRRASSVLSSGAALAVVTLLALASSTIGGDLGAAELATIGGSERTLEDGSRGTPRGDEADDGDDAPGSGRSRRSEADRRSTDAGDELAGGLGSGTEGVDGGAGSTTSTTKPGDATAATAAQATTSTTADPCRNSTDPACGDFYFDPPLAPDQPAEISIVASPASPRVGETVTFTVTVIDPDGTGPACESFDPDAKDIEPPAADGGEGVPTQGSCAGASPRSVSLARYGPWDPPEPTPSRHEVTFTATYTVPGQRTAVYETTDVGRCDAGATCPSHSKEIVLTVQP